MPTHLSLLCCAGTASARAGGFPDPAEPLDEGGLAKARACRLERTPGLVLRSPSRAAVETAAAMGIGASAEPQLADIAFGAWTGLSFAELHERDPAAFAGWLADPRQAAPGGESFEALRARVRPWLAEMTEREAATLAISHAMPIRAILAEALGLPDDAAMRFDIAPLSVAMLSHHRGWRLQQIRAD
ncbi:histidine phosphatase family protein [Sphingomonas sp. PR090111-T3T-6A]|uniref:histidine phosphatase family protein n=1 Tax=Sphingomonas sp. PR090111-T3T-6A TaxID=685778 RepID=UPI00035FA19B|nr:histidine phosphatase family protein [Sphingomonas sp. PR090111-T3T-6A]